jgi:hypothetical protein
MKTGGVTEQKGLSAWRCVTANGNFLADAMGINISGS